MRSCWCWAAQPRWRRPTPSSGPGTIKFALSGAANKAATSVCPGTTYKVALNFPEPRLALLTASAGKFTQSSPECPNRQYFDRSEGFGPKAVQEVSLVIPCGQVEPIVLKVTSARGPASAYYQSTSTLPIGANCVATDACKAAAAKAATKPAGTPLAAASKPTTAAATAIPKPAPVVMAPKPGY